MKGVLKTLLILLLVVAGTGFLFRYYLVNSGTSYFPYPGKALLVGTFSGADSTESKIFSNSFVIAGSEHSDVLLFSLMKEAYEPRLIPLKKTGPSGEDGQRRFEPVLIDAQLQCHMSGTLEKSVLKGSVKCEDGIKVDFKAFRAGMSPLISKGHEGTPGYSMPEVQEVMSEMSRLQVAQYGLLKLEDKRDFLGSNLEKLGDVTNNSELKESIENFQNDMLALEEKIKELEQKKQILAENRSQLFRVTERGVEVELERRLSKMEYDSMSTGSEDNKHPAGFYPDIEKNFGERADFSEHSHPGEWSDQNIDKITDQGGGNEWWKVMQ